MKLQHLTNNNDLDIQTHPLYQEAVALVRELNKLTEGKSLNRGEIHDLFKGAEEAMTAGGGNRTMLGKAGELAGALGNKIKALGQALQDTTVIKGVDAKFDELKQVASRNMGKSPEGSKVLRALDTYKQTAQRYPTTSKFFWGVAGVLTGLLTSGAAPVLALGAMKMIDGLMQGEQFSTAAGRATRPVGAALGAKALAGAADAAAQGIDTAVDTVQNINPDKINPFKSDVTPPGPDNVNPPGPDNVVPPGGETQTITVKQGGTLSDISAKYKVDPDVMAKLNPGKFGPSGNPNILMPGDQIVLPKNIDAAAYKGPYSGDNAMTAQNIQNKMDAGQYGSDQGMAAKRIAADAAAAKAKTAASSAPSAQTPAPSAQGGPADVNLTGKDPNIRPVPFKPGANSNLVRTESIKIKKGRGILEGFDIITAPVGMLVDRQATVRKWALNESLGRNNKRSVQLNEAGIRTVFANLERLHEFAMDEARRNNIGRERSKAMGAAAGRAGQSAQQFAQSNPTAAADISASTPEPGIPDPGFVDSFAAGRGERTSADLQKDQQGGTVRSRPANANDPAAMAKNARTSATNVSNTAGPMAGLTGGNVGGLATGTAPAGNTMPYLAADPEGKFKTKGQGPLGGSLMRGVEGGLKRFGNWAGDTWREATTKVTLNGLLRHWQDAGSPTDSDEVAKLLVSRKVPPEVIKQLFTQLNFPAPELDAPVTAAGAAGGAAGGADAIDPYNRDDQGNVRFFANGAPDMSAGVSSTDTGAGGAGAGGSTTTTTTTSGGMQGSTPGGTTTGGAQGDGQIASATSMILPQLARMTGPAYADDLITIIDTALSVLQRSAPTAYREKIAQFRGMSAGKQREKPADIITRTKKTKKGTPATDAPPASKPLGPSKVVANNPGAPTPAKREKFDQQVAQASAAQPAVAEQRRAYGGKYIKESADTKLAREFENFVLDAVQL